MRNDEQWIDWTALWVCVFGLWPLADPGHHADSFLSVLDIALHIAATIVLLCRWKVVRRTSITKEVSRHE